MAEPPAPPPATGDPTGPALTLGPGATAAAPDPTAGRDQVGAPNQAATLDPAVVPNPAGGDTALAGPAGFTFWTLAGLPLATPAEWQPALVAAPVPVAAWAAARYTRQEVAAPLTLRQLAGQVCVVAEWPRSGPGHYELAVTWPGPPATPAALIPPLPHRRTRRLTITPVKLSTAAYATLLADLETRLPVAVAIALQRAGGLSGVVLPPPGESTLAQEVARLRRVVAGVPGKRPGLAAILASLAADPHHMLRSTAEWTRQHRARRPTPARLAGALTRPGNWDGVSLQAVVDTRIAATVDVYENRLVAALIQQVSQRLRTLLVHHSLTGVHRTEVAALLETVRRARRTAPFLNEVSLAGPVPIRPSMVLLKRPPYRAALAAYLELRRAVAVHLDAPDLSAPLTNLPALYQLWGTLSVIDTLLTVAPEAGFTLTHERLTRRDSTGLFLRVLPDGQPALVFARADGATLRLIPEPSYSHISGPLRSLSFAQRPDIAIEFRPGPEAPPVVVIFDPKYKLDGELLPAPDTADAAEPVATALPPAVSSPAGVPKDPRPQKVDIDKMHAYRDAIRTAAGTPVVTAAAILYPGPTVHYGPEVAALHAVPGDTAALIPALTAILAHTLRR